VTSAWILYLAAAIFAELVLLVSPVATALLDAAVIVIALTHFGWAQRSPLAIGEPGVRLLPAVALIPLVRLLSLTLPIPDLPPLAWLGLIAAPLLLAIVVTARLSRLGVGQMAIAPLAARWTGIVVVVVSVPIGVLVGWISPATIPVAADSPWMAGLTAATLVGAAAIPEELIFRGLLQPLLHNVTGELAPFIGAAVFAATYIGWQSPALVAVMAGVGLMYGIELARSRSLWPAILGHSALVLAAAFIAPLILT
jgi:membrane protease YdiL (CAAX protease family)